LSAWYSIKATDGPMRADHFVLNPLAYTDVPETAGLARSINS